MPTPMVGDLVQIKDNLEGCYDTNSSMQRYAGRQTRVMTIMPIDKSWRGKHISYTVKLDIDQGYYFWYEDGLIFDPDDAFKC